MSWRGVLLSALAFHGLADLAHAQTVASEPISAKSPQRDADIAAVTKWLTHEAGCEETKERREAVSVDTLSYYDFKGNGTKALIVVALTCNTGTAGPDVHAVLFRDGKGGFEEYDLPDVAPKYFEQMEGNRNFALSMDLTVETGLLVATWHDRSDRPDSPLVVRYRWRGNGFVVDSIISRP